MADDLEENIFKRNIPGKYSTWDRDERSSDRGGGCLDDYDEDCVGVRESSTIDEAQGSSTANRSEEELLEYARYLAKSDIPESVRNNILAERAGLPSTGVKGVLADYKAHQATVAAQRMADAEQRQQVLMRMARGHVVSSQDQEVVGTGSGAATQLNKSVPHKSGQDPDDSSSDNERVALQDADDDDEDAFMRDYRAKRLKELKEQSLAAAAPSFGTVRDITAADFLSEVDGEDARVWVVVHLYEPALQVCVRMNNLLEEIATKMTHVKFLRMQCSSNAIEIDRVALPTLTIYRGGNMQQTLAAICEELGSAYFTKEDVEWLLESIVCQGT